MGSKGLLNLTLDEIIQRQRGFRKSSVQYTNRKGNFGRPGNSFQPRFRDLNSTLSNRLSRRTGGGFNTPTGLRRNGPVASTQLRSTASKPRKSVYSRLTINNPRKPVNLGQGSGVRSIKTRNAEDFHPVRINNGAIVQGLRSDQLLLQKLNQHRNRSFQAKLDKLRTLQDKKAQAYERRERRSSWKSPQSSKVSMDVNHGLMVSFANEVVRKPRTRRFPSSRAPSFKYGETLHGKSAHMDCLEGSGIEPPVVKSRRYASPSPPPYSSSSSSSSSSEDSDVLPSTSRRVSTEPPKDPLTSILRLGLERPPPPKPHRQVLDPAVQREIAALQGYNEAHSVGPGPGVKGFKMMPSRTKSSLNERFTIERNVND